MSSAETTSTAGKKNLNFKSPIDFLFAKRPEGNIKLGKTMAQTSINDTCKEARARAVKYISVLGMESCILKKFQIDD